MIRALKKHRKLLLITLVAVIAFVVVLEVSGATNILRNEPAVPDTTQQDDGINYGPPTAEELEDTDRHKEDLANLPDDTPPPSDEQKKVIPLISSAAYFDDETGNRVEIRSFVPGIYEADGICKATLTHATSVTMTREVKAVQDATTTRCSVVKIPQSEFSAVGEWTVTITYTSVQFLGTSEPKLVRVE